VRERDDLARRQPLAVLAGDVRERDQPRSRPDRGPQPLEQRLDVGRQRDAPERDPAPLGQVDPGQLPGRVLLIGQQHLVAGLPVHAPGDRVDPLGDVARQRDLVRPDVQRRGQLGAQAGRDGREQLAPGRRVQPDLLEPPFEVERGVEDAARGGAGPAGVEVVGRREGRDVGPDRGQVELRQHRATAGAHETDRPQRSR
jgi:hypothetical protein